MEEVWLPVKRFEGLYEVSNKGNVRSLDKYVLQYNNGTITKHFYKGQVLIPQKDKGGYLRVNLYKDRKMHGVRISRIVAESFLPNPFNLPEVNHKEEKAKGNNCVENLEWCDKKYNINYGTRNERAGRKCEKPIIQKRLDGTTVFVWRSTKEASETGGFSITGICQALRKKQKTHKGFIWEYF